MVTLISLKDADPNPIYDEEIYLYASSIKFASGNILSATPVTMADPSILGFESIETNIDRRRPYISHSSTNQIIITIKGRYTKDISKDNPLGTIQDSKLLMTPYKLMRIFYSGHKFYLKDDFIFPELNSADGISSNDPDKIYNENGIPVVVQSFNFDYIGGNDKEIVYNLTLWEDRYTDIED